MPFVSLFCQTFLIRKFILPFSSLVMETNLCTRLKLRSPSVFTLILFYVTVAEAFAIFIDADARIKGVQIGDYEIKQ